MGQFPDQKQQVICETMVHKNIHLHDPGFTEQIDHNGYFFLAHCDCHKSVEIRYYLDTKIHICLNLFIYSFYFLEKEEKENKKNAFKYKECLIMQKDKLQFIK